MKVSIAITPSTSHDVTVDYSIAPSGHGHYKVTAVVTADLVGRKTFTTVTSNMPFIDEYKDAAAEVTYEEAQQMLHDQFFSSIEDAVADWLYQVAA
jgi:hypothetical protein